MDNFVKESSKGNVPSEEKLGASGQIVSLTMDAMGEWLLQEDLEEPMEEQQIVPENKPNNNNGLFLGISGAELLVEPPDNIRKSNFFNFTLRLKDINHQSIPLKSASFDRFRDDGVRNGVGYLVNILLPNQTVCQQNLIVRLIDSYTKQVIPYEGSCSNPDTSRVLLTHRAACMRCSEDKTCGNKNETPTDPDILENFKLRFYLKCNQNCLRGAGNPKRGRRFQLVVYSSDKLDSALCYSRDMFVHNNSKHAKPRPGKAEEEEVVTFHVGVTLPTITAISPCEGWTMGGQTVIIIGEGFSPDLQVIFGSVSVRCQMVSSHAVRVQSPPHPRPETVQVYLVLGPHQYCRERPGTFNYLSPSEPSLDYGFSRLSGLVPRFNGDPARLPREIVLKRTADIIEQFISMGQMLGQQQQVPISVHLQEQAEVIANEIEDHNVQDDVNNLLAPWPQEEAKDVPYNDM